MHNKDAFTEEYISSISCCGRCAAPSAPHIATMHAAANSAEHPSEGELSPSLMTTCWRMVSVARIGCACSTYSTVHVGATAPRRRMTCRGR